MFTDVIDLQDFYASSLGQMTRRVIRRHVRMMWPDVTQQSVLGLGYATPYLRPFKAEAARLFAIMPAAQGIMFWPAEGPGLVALSDEAELPLPDSSVDRVLLIHGLEATEQPRPLLREIWRVMASGGRLLVIVPNRRGIWARVDRTPFGNGQPYSLSQLRRVLRDAQFVLGRSDSALFIPPVQSRFLLRSAPAWEEIGSRWFSAIAGVHILEASKQLYAPVNRVADSKAARVRSPLILPLPGGILPDPAGFGR